MRRAKAQSFLSGNSDGVGPFGLTFGGGIANHGGALTVSGCTLSGNAASFEGGGTANLSTLTVSGSTLCGNSATYGGGIYNVVFATLKVSNTTIVSGNSALDGGGLYNLGTAASRNT